MSEAKSGALARFPHIAAVLRATGSLDLVDPSRP